MKVEALTGKKDSSGRGRGIEKDVKPNDENLLCECMKLSNKTPK